MRDTNLNGSLVSTTKNALPLLSCGKLPTILVIKAATNLTHDHIH